MANFFAQSWLNSILFLLQIRHTRVPYIHPYQDTVPANRSWTFQSSANWNLKRSFFCIVFVHSQAMQAHWLTDWPTSTGNEAINSVCEYCIPLCLPLSLPISCHEYLWIVTIPQDHEFTISLWITSKWSNFSVFWCGQTAGRKRPVRLSKAT
jgi:hypothetical protein